MRITLKQTAALLVVLASMLLCQSLCAQSLGEIARQKREKNKQQATSTNKVLTNEDISRASQSAQTAPNDSPKKNSANQTSSAISEPSAKDDAPSADELKAAIQEKKEAIAEIQDRITKIQSTINYVQDNRNIYTNAPEYNEAQKRKEQEVNRLKGILQEQQDELKDLQETARKAGYGSTIYD